MSIRLRPAARAGRAALLCLACWSGAGSALELHPDRLTRLAEARYGPHAAQVVADWLRQLHDDIALSERDKLARVNAFWNRSAKPGPDCERWATPLETLGTGKAGCADYVIGKYFSLVALGVPVDRLRFIYATAHRAGGPSVPHMVLAYYATPDSVPLVLDDLMPEVLAASERADLTPVFMLGTDGPYLDARTPADRAGRWRDLLLRLQREGLDP